MCSDNWLDSVSSSRRCGLGLGRRGCVDRVVKILSNRNQSLVSRIRGSWRRNGRPKRGPPRGQLGNPLALVVLIEEANRDEEVTMTVVGALGDTSFVDELARAKRVARREDRLEETTS